MPESLMAKSAAERQRLKRKRDRRGLVRANAWLEPWAVEAAIDSGAISEAGSSDPDTLGAFAAKVFEERFEKVLRSDLG